jgi:hypothetical protein
MPELPTPMLARCRELLASPKFVWLVVVLAILLGLPTLDIGLVGDDLAQQAFLRRQHEGGSTAPWWNMFALVEGPPAKNIGLRTAGRYPWWVDPDLRIVFFRPLAVATHHVDHWLWPRAVWMMHLHSVLWHALACALAWAIARRLCASPTTAGLAAIIYTISFSHAIPVAWLAHRNGLVSTVFALAALLAHDLWRRDQNRLAAVIAPMALLASLSSAEAGVVVLGFFVAYALTIDRGPRRVRALALLPALLVIVGWRIAYVELGFGAVGSGAYVDPLGDPGAFAAVFPERYAWLLGSSVSPPLMVQVPTWLWLTLTLAVFVTVAVFLIRESSSVARFGALAVALGCVPLATSHPGDRLLVLASFGIALTLAELLDRWLLDQASAPRKLAACLVGFVHVLVPPVAVLALSAGLDEFAEQGQAPAYGESIPDDLQHKGLVLVHAPNYVSAEYLPAMRASRGLSVPNFTWLLHEGLEAPAITRVDARTLELHDPLGWPASGFSEYWRSASHRPFTVGETIRTVDFVAEVLEVDAGKATRMRFRFRTQLEHPTFVWAAWDGHDFAPVEPR